MTQQDAIAKVADELEIRNLIGKLALASDEGTVEDYGALFAEDAVWRMAGPVAGAHSFPPRVGRREIVAGLVERRANNIGGPGSHTRHAIYQSVVRVDGDSANARSYCAYNVDLDKAPSVRLFTVYQDTFVRTAGGWKLRSRDVEPS